MLSIVVFALSGAAAAVTLGIEASKHFDPSGSALGGTLRPCTPAGGGDKAVYIFSEAVGKVALERAGPKDSNVFNSPIVFRASVAVVDNASDEGFLFKVISMGNLKCFVSGFSLFFRPQNSNDDFVDVGHP